MPISHVSTVIQKWNKKGMNKVRRKFSLLLNLGGWKTADKDAYWFSLEVSLFSPISNENLP